MYVLNIFKLQPYFSSTDKSAKSGKAYKGGEGILVFKHAEVNIY